MTLPLADFKIVEFGNLVAAPYCGMLLADLGAEVVKVEAITGDLAREIGPFYGDESAFFISVNRGKKSLAADAKAESIKPVLRKLCIGADVVLHNLRLGAMERMGLGYQDLRNDGAHLVYAMITAFGGSGPASARPGIDLIFQGESGMMSIAGGADDPPQKTATTIGDFVAGTNAALTIAAALAAGGGRRGGRGRLVEVSLRDGLIAVQAGWNALFFAHGVQPPRTGTASPVTAPNQTFCTADGFVNVAVVSDSHFRDLCNAIEMGDVASDPQFGSNTLRVANRMALAAILEPAFLVESTGHWIEVLGRAGVPVGRILEFEEVFSDPQAVHNEMVIEVEHPKAGAIRTQGSPLRLDGFPARAESPAPFLGQHSRSVLADLGVSADQIEEFIAAGAVVA